SGIEIFRDGKAGTRAGYHKPQAPTIFPIAQDCGADQSPFKTCDVSVGSFRMNSTEGKILADFATELSSDLEEQNCKWMLHVDGSSNANDGGAGILIQGPKEVEIEVTAQLSFPITNNEAEYEALILGLELAYEAGARDLEIFTNSQLVALHNDGTYETREKTMISYRDIVKNWMDKFDKCSISQVPGAENNKADAWSMFGAAMSGIRDRKVTALVRERLAISGKAEVHAISEVESWKDEIVKYLENGTLREDPIKAKSVRFRVARFTLLSGQLYKQTLKDPY
ncbi:UNVERIFIED_CONTAM: hypothetical protein Sindi_0946600, partial [Sesamum indicum]